MQVLIISDYTTPHLRGFEEVKFLITFAIAVISSYQAKAPVTSTGEFSKEIVAYLLASSSFVRQNDSLGFARFFQCKEEGIGGRIGSKQDFWIGR